MTREHPAIQSVTLRTWHDLVEAIEYLRAGEWVFRGHDNAEWTLQTSLERQTRAPRAGIEQSAYWTFVRSAPRLLPGHLVPADNDAAAWLGLIQHYGGPTRLLDVTRSQYVALLFAFEALGDHDRALWAIDRPWCAAECARTMAENEGIDLNQCFGRVFGAQAQLVFSLVHTPFPDPLFASFTPFVGVFPLEPWKPDVRQSAQQASFLCTADVDRGFMENMAEHSFTEHQVLYKFVLKAGLREEVLDRLGVMSVTAATLFPGLDGLARSLRTLGIRRARNAETPPPWEV